MVLSADYISRCTKGYWISKMALSSFEDIKYSKYHRPTPTLIGMSCEFANDAMNLLFVQGQLKPRSFKHNIQYAWPQNACSFGYDVVCVYLEGVGWIHVFLQAMQTETAVYPTKYFFQWNNISICRKEGSHSLHSMSTSADKALTSLLFVQSPLVIKN